MLLKAPSREMEGNQTFGIINELDSQFLCRGSDNSEFAQHIWYISNQGSYNNGVSECAINILFLLSPTLQKKTFRRRLNPYLLRKMVGQEMEYSIISGWMERWRCIRLILFAVLSSIRV